VLATTILMLRLLLLTLRRIPFTTGEPYLITWSTLGTGENNLSAGSYTITITDALNCVKVSLLIMRQFYDKSKCGFHAMVQKDAY
jgi:hypothetical protein